MKKKLLCFLLCGVILVELTGCGNKETKSGTNTGNDTNKSKEELNVSYIYGSSDNYILLKADDNSIYIVDADMNYIGSINQDIDEEDEISINNDGYVYVDNSKTHKIYDKTGKIVFEDDEKNEYHYLTSNNYTLRKSTTNDYNSGKSTTCEIIDMKGDVIQTTDCDYKYVGAHIWAQNSTKLANEYDYYSDKNNKTISLKYNYDEFEEAGNYIIDDSKFISIDENLNLVNIVGNQDDSDSLISYSMKIINDTYFYNGNDNSIYKYDGTKVKTIDSGEGIYKIIYDSKDKEYYVVSNTGYAYIMNEKFENETDPVEIPGGTLGHVSDITKNFIIVSNENCTLYDYNGKELKKLTFDQAKIYSRGNYIQVQNYDSSGKNTTSEYYDITNFDKLVMYK